MYSVSFDSSSGCTGELLGASGLRLPTLMYSGRSHSLFPRHLSRADEKRKKKKGGHKQKEQTGTQGEKGNTKKKISITVSYVYFCGIGATFSFPFVLL